MVLSCPDRVKLGEHGRRIDVVSIVEVMIIVETGTKVNTGVIER